MHGLVWWVRGCQYVLCRMYHTQCTKLITCECLNPHSLPCAFNVAYMAIR